MQYATPAKSILLVQFLGTTASGDRSGKGPLYEYISNHPVNFQAFRKAASQGGWVWDELRVRGSRVEHQYQYKLTRVWGGYLPRRATIRDGKELLVRRQGFARAKPGEQPQYMQSQLPTQVIGNARSTKQVNGRPINRGRPNRGRPNRGR